MSTTPGPFVQSTALFLAKGMVPTFAQRCHTQCSKFLSFHEILVGYERDFQFVDDDHSQYSAADHLLWQHCSAEVSHSLAATCLNAQKGSSTSQLRPMVRARETSRCCLFHWKTLDVFSSKQMGKSSLRRGTVGTVGLLKNRSTAKSSCNRTLAFLGECDLRDCLVWVNAPEKMGYHNPQSTS